MQKRKSEYESRVAPEMLYASNTDVASDAKKVRLESGAGQEVMPSRVLHLRRLPLNVTESEVAMLAVPFGVINKMVLTKKTGQALLELSSEESATAMLHYYTSVCQPTIRGSQSIIVQYSKYPELTTATSSPHIEDAISAANKQGEHMKSDNLEDGQKRVIRVQMDGAPPAALNYLPFYKLFRQFGEVDRIIVYQSNNKPQALIEFKTPLAAQVAKLQANNIPMFPELPMSSGVMRIDFSRQTTLEVRSENDNRRDFISNPMTEMELKKISRPSMGFGGGAGMDNGFNNGASNSDNLPSMIKAAQYLSATTGTTNIIDKHGNVDNVALAAIAGRVIQPLLAAAAGRGNPVDAAILQQQLAALQQLAPNTNVEGIAGIDVPHRFHLPQQAQQQTNGVVGGGGTGGSAGGVNMLGDNGGILQSAFGGMPPQGSVDMMVGGLGAPINASPVVIVSGLDVTRVNPDTLFILFGVYGDVQRVKIMYSKKDTALVQYTDATQAASAVSNLNGVSLYGTTIHCNFSKHFQIKMSQANDQGDSAGALPPGATDVSNGDAGSATRDYSQHRLHRFKRVNSRNHRNVYPPSCVLHVSNLPDSITEAELTRLFTSVTGYEVVNCKLMANDKKMALVQMESIDHAVAALIDMHDYQISDNNRIRVSFSKSVKRS